MTTFFREVRDDSYSIRNGLQSGISLQPILISKHPYTANVFSPSLGWISLFGWQEDTLPSCPAKPSSLLRNRTFRLRSSQVNKRKREWKRGRETGHRVCSLKASPRWPKLAHFENPVARMKD